LITPHKNEKINYITFSKTLQILLGWVSLE